MFVMISHKSTFYLGIFIFVIPFLGFPTSWKMGLVVFGGLMLMIISLKTPLPRKLVKASFKKEKIDFVPEVTKAKVEIPNATPEIKKVAPEFKEIKIEKPKEKIVVSPIPIVNVTPVSKKTRSVKVDSVRKPKVKQL